MILGGFVIHGNNVATLGRCLGSLAEVSDHLVAVDSGSTDGSAALIDARGVRRIVQPWEGYGAARARAVRELPPSCDVVFFLDSDEALPPQSVAAINALKSRPMTADGYSLPRRDWAELNGTGRRFVFRTEWRKRLVKREHARWTREMIVHEALRGVRTERVNAPIDHLFATSLEERTARNARYALLWALQAHCEGRRPKSPAVEALAHTVRNALLHGALFRGGAAGARLSRLVARYHSEKHRLLQEVREGQHAELLDLYRRGELGALFAQVHRMF